MLHFIWKERDSIKSRKKVVLLICVLKNNCSINLLKFPTQNPWWSSWFSKAESWNIEGYNFIKLYQGDFLEYFPKFNTFRQRVVEQIMNVQSLTGKYQLLWSGSSVFKKFRKIVWKKLFFEVFYPWKTHWWLLQMKRVNSLQNIHSWTRFKRSKILRKT